MTATKIAAKQESSRCISCIPNVCKPTETQLSHLDKEDCALLLKYLEEPLEYMDHELFHKPNTQKLLFGSKDGLVPETTYFKEPAPIESSSKKTGSASTLNTAQEILLFQRFNYSRMRIFQLFEKYADKQMPFDAIRESLAWAHRASAARGQIAQANIPLVLAMAKRTRLNGLDFNDLISEGDFALLRSIDKFDCSRGFKFSTYACRAILKSFSRVALRTSRYRCHFPTEFDPELEKGDFIEHKRDGIETDCVDEIREIIAENRAALNEIEQTVIRERFALEAASTEVKPKTLEQVGKMIGVTKERVRQIQNKALKKIRSILEDNFLAA